MEEEINEYTVTYWMACWILYHMQRYTIIIVKLSKFETNPKMYAEAIKHSLHEDQIII